MRDVASDSDDHVASCRVHTTRVVEEVTTTKDSKFANEDFEDWEGGVSHCSLTIQAVKWMEGVEELAKHRFLGDPANEKHVISRMERAHIAYSGKYL